MNIEKDMPQRNRNVDDEHVRLPYWLKASLTVVIFAVIGILMLYRWRFPGIWGDQEIFAQFGDFIGGTINPLLGFATIGLLVWSINIQLKELRETRIEARDSRLAFQEQLDIARKETNLKQMQMAIDQFVKERGSQLDRKIHPDLVRTIAQKLYDASETGNSASTFSSLRDQSIADLVKGLEGVNYRLILENLNSFEINGDILNSLVQSVIRDTVITVILSDERVVKIINTYLYFTLKIVDVLYDYHDLTDYKAYTIMSLWKESVERLQLLKILFDDYGVEPISDEHYKKLLKRIENIDKLDIL
jgi:hypothetical protein